MIALNIPQTLNLKDILKFRFTLGTSQFVNSLISRLFKSTKIHAMIEYWLICQFTLLYWLFQTISIGIQVF